VPDTICNTSPLIALDNIGLLGLLEGVYGRVLVAEEVRNEFGSELPGWIDVVPVQNRNLIRALQLSIDLGESATLALAMERQDARVILDDLKGRKVAQRLGVSFTGLLGVAIKGKQMGLIEAVDNLMTRLKQVGFRLSSAMEQDALRLAGEQDVPR
jgi:predicted nucleic acid-binding protein